MPPATDRPTPRKVAFHIAAIVLLDTVALLVLSDLLAGFVLDGFLAALETAALLGLLNGFVWPVIARHTVRLSVLTLGGFALIGNAALLLVAVWVIPGAHLHDGWSAVWVTLWMSVLMTLVSSTLMFDADEVWYRSVVRRQARRRGEHVESAVPGVIFLEIDGLAHAVLRNAVSAGNAPTLARWLGEGTHRLARWETDWSSQTGACQAGLLHGSNDDMPAFRWWEKDRGTAIVTNHPRDAAELERRHSDGKGLLYEDGASRANILSGDATHSMLTMSTVLTRRGRIGRDYATYFAQPYAVAYTAVAVVAEVFRERRAARRQRRQDVRPRIARGWTYAAMRAYATVIQLDLQVAAVVGDMLAGRPAVYTTFLAYDEVAHHSGIQRPDTLDVLRRVDERIARIARVAGDAARPYRLVVLSDHGQSQGATFADRYGETLEQVVRGATQAAAAPKQREGEDDAVAYLSAGLTEVARQNGVVGRTVRTATRGRQVDGAVALTAADRQEAAPAADASLPELSVMASGCLGLVSFPREPGRLTAERLEELYPALLPALVAHPGVGFVLVRSERHGPLAIGSEGVHHLDGGRIEGSDPLAPFGPNAPRHVRRTDGFAHCPDLLVNSVYWTETDEVAAFEELVGSHGGMGGTQSFPFVLHPADLPWPDADVVGAENVHHVLRGWLAQLGHTAYASASDDPGSSTSTFTAGARDAT